MYVYIYIYITRRHAPARARAGARLLQDRRPLLLRHLFIQEVPGSIPSIDITSMRISFLFVNNRQVDMPPHAPGPGHALRTIFASPPSSPAFPLEVTKVRMIQPVYSYESHETSTFQAFWPTPPSILGGRDQMTA